MAYQAVNVGTVADDHTGDPGRTAFQKVNAMFAELYGATSTSVTSAPYSADPTGVAVAGDVGEGFLHDAVEVQGMLVRQ